MTNSDRNSPEAASMAAPCIGNALFKLTGKRFRALPLSPERVKAVTGV
jgi:CO/xanthine dehydrogenase Mo-binding subunit